MHLYVSGIDCYYDKDQKYIVDIRDVTPAEGDWIQAVVEEATAHTGPWQEVDTFTIVGEPPYNFVSEVGEFSAGLYRVVFYDADGNEWISEQIVRHAGVWYDVRPSAQSVADLLRARLTDRFNKKTDIWTKETNPTIEQVERTIDQATNLFIISIGRYIPSRLRREAETVVALQAACLIEPSSQPEQSNSDRSPAKMYAAMYLSALEALKKNIENQTAGSPRVPWGNIAVTGATGFDPRYHPDKSNLSVWSINGGLIGGPGCLCGSPSCMHGG